MTKETSAAVELFRNFKYRLQFLWKSKEETRLPDHQSFQRGQLTLQPADLQAAKILFFKFSKKKCMCG